MFDRYTDPARRAVYLAGGLAQAGRLTQAGTGHLLLGIMYEHDSSAARALTTLGLTRDTVADAVSAVLRDAPPAPWASTTPFSPRLQTVLQDAAREAIRLGCSCVGTEHLLLALVTEREPAEGNDGYRGTAVEVLARLGAEAAAVRAAILRGNGSEQPVIMDDEGQDTPCGCDGEVRRRLGRLERVLDEHVGEAHEIQRKLGLVE